ncbi:proton-conducting transporter membrane subunit [Halomonas mongoliensis]|uniref:Proton-conducting transporter membrane subunit n=1 Tax=Halomonas mongoliensis TaxID=321265 RepID=A0ABU1GKA1_9GAMM|nr:proton-conducting transporter membrane subunit [Halomonas mongoliensis]MDR5892404.1 proton-conducting transporter membrane subunit [Halomonas mongoliensis]
MSQEIFAALMIAALLWPLLLMLREPLMAALVGRGEVRFPLDPLWATAPLPALALALLGGDGSLTLSAWLLGGVWVLDEPRRVLLGFTALLWLLAGWYARGYLAGDGERAVAGNDRAASRLARFALLWPLTLTGNLLLLLAEDIASFYLGFAVMTFAAYGLVIHSGTRDALTGGRAYLIMAVLGEGLILGGLLWGAGSLGTLTLGGLREGLVNLEHGVWIGLLLWLGFGVKAGVAGLHLWLPLAHPVAPTPASAVLSGAMVKAGVVGWMATLPLGEPAATQGFVELGRAMLAVGLVGALGAALVGGCQRHPKAVLAYSSVSQLGMLAALVGAGLTAPGLWPALAPAVVLFAAHHGLTKGALFLGVGIGEHPPRLPAWALALLLALPALSLAGALGSGLATKWAFKAALYDGGHSGLVAWLSLAAVGTTLLMARTLWCQWQGERQARHNGLMPLSAPMPLAWLLLLASGLLLPAWLPLLGAEGGSPPREELAGLWWPLLAGLALVLPAIWLTRRGVSLAWHRPPPGDLWWPLSRAAGRLVEAARAGGERLAAIKGGWVAWWMELERSGTAALDALGEGESWLRRHAALLTMAVAVGLALVLLFGAA